MPIAHRRAHTLDDYFDVEARSEAKHEFIDGEIVAMAGGSPRHNAIARNVLRILAEATRGAGCAAFGSDQRVATPDGLFTYPDLSLFCGPIVWVPGRPATGANPTVLVEVLAESTRDYDRGAKHETYKRIESLRDVLLIETTTARIEHWQRSPAGWVLQIVAPAQTGLVLSGAGVRVEMDEVYEEVWSLPE